MGDMRPYKVKAPCRVGGAFRRAGEIILLPRFDGETPAFLEEAPERPDPATEPAKPAPRSRGPKRSGLTNGAPAAPGPGQRELGVTRDEPVAPAPGPVDGSA